MSLENWLRLLCDDWLRGQQQIRIEKNWGLEVEVVSCTDKAIQEIESAETKSRL